MRWQERRDWKTLLLNLMPVCWYCGWWLEDLATLDHLQPTSAGGEDSYENLRLCCWRCNQRKRNRPLSEITVCIHRGYGVLYQQRGQQ